ncbi:hypothetical protein PUR59_04160 [Streptomyces sp. SP18ES09]|uniref:hypothetical protein n=1 Tax=Streptomyces sp. SP18ES09 TaxID=3002532 RepID=UPI002E7A357C|nr:hypothetical protein [Streptomyces sp. SP18ES09]MEE1814214.1 hypothetical protein [Streptomyces sp. SP18ES09]
MITYFNRNTGDTAQYDEPNTRLDALDNWVRVEDEQPLPSLVSDGVLSRPHLQVDNPVRVLNPPDGGDPIHEDGSRGPAKADGSGTGAHTLLTTETSGDNPAGSPLTAERPADDATVEAWRAYAAPLAETPQAQADVAGMTRDELVAAYGDGADRSAEKRDPGKVPARAATKGEWQAYAHTRAQDSDEEASIDGMTKEELVAKYGGDS